MARENVKGDLKGRIRTTKDTIEDSTKMGTLDWEAKMGMVLQRGTQGVMPREGGCYREGFVKWGYTKGG